MPLICSKNLSLLGHIRGHCTAEVTVQLVEYLPSILSKYPVAHKQGVMVHIYNPRIQ